MRITIIHPAIGHKRNENYIRSWQMEPLPAATIAGHTPSDVEVSFYDDRMELIPYDEPTDAVAISIETYTAKRAYQIASEYRKRNIPVVLGGFHATLLPEEAERYGDAIVIGEAEGIWPTVVDDLRHGCLKKRYQSKERLPMDNIKVDRSIFRGKGYLPIGLIETGRGCRFPCNFCSIQTFFERSYRRRPVEHVINDLKDLRKEKRVFFFVDDNFAGDIKAAKEFMRAITPLKVRWITQMSINAAHDEEFLHLLHTSGCVGVLIGFESLDEANLKLMNKGFNLMKGGFKNALANLRRYQIRIYATFVFGYQNDVEETFRKTVEFAINERFYIAAFNHLTPFPGTPLYKQMQADDELHYEAWWLDDRYRYNDVPFNPKQLSSEDITRLCVESRREFYSWKSIIKRLGSRSNTSNAFMLRNYLPINHMHRVDVSGRNGYPLGDEAWQGELLEAVR
jgi:radical SAM superfamily enzyme YgiQ (UPF0313 family)